MKQEEVALGYACPRRWETLDGDGARRWCGECRKHVVDLSAGSELRARWTLFSHRSAEPPCVRYRTDSSGRLQFKPGLLAKVAAAMLALVPAAAYAEPAVDAELVDDVDAQPGQVHLCAPAYASNSTSTSDSDYQTVYLGEVGGRLRRRIRWPLRLRLSRPHGGAMVHVAADPERFSRAAVRCRGSQLPRAERLVDGEAVIDNLPDWRECRVRLKGEGRPMVLEFVAGQTQAEVELSRP